MTTSWVAGAFIGVTESPGSGGGSGPKTVPLSGPRRALRARQLHTLLVSAQPGPSAGCNSPQPPQNHAEPTFPITLSMVAPALCTISDQELLGAWTPASF